MKKIMCLVLLLVAANAYSQLIKIDSISIVKSEDKIETIDISKYPVLEEFNNEFDAVVYIYRLKSMVGAAVKWQIHVDDGPVAKLKQKEFFTVHIDTREPIHAFYFPDMLYNYTNFKPNTYYYVMLKGFDMKTGYLSEKTLKELESCNFTASLSNE